MIEDYDPKDAGTITSVVVEDVPRPAAEVERQHIVVRVLKQLRRSPTEILPSRSRPAAVIGKGIKSEFIYEFVTFSSVYLRYEATRIGRELREKSERSTVVRISTIRALMHSVRLPEVKETIEFEDAL